MSTESTLKLAAGDQKDIFAYFLNGNIRLNARFMGWLQVSTRRKLHYRKS